MGVPAKDPRKDPGPPGVPSTKATASEARDVDAPPSNFIPELSVHWYPRVPEPGLNTKTVNSYSSYSSLQKAKPVGPGPLFCPETVPPLNSSPKMCGREKPWSQRGWTTHEQCQIRSMLSGKGCKQLQRDPTKEYDVLVSATWFHMAKKQQAHLKSLGFSQNSHLPKSYNTSTGLFKVYLWKEKGGHLNGQMLSSPMTRNPM